MRKTNKQDGITLVALVITIMILIILAGITIAQLTGKGLFGRVLEAKKENDKQTAAEKMNLKITNIQISSYADTQKLPNLQYLADKLCEDDDMEYVLTTSKEHASLDKIDVTNLSSIYTKLKNYPYEFEINSSLQLASIDGIKIADNNNDDETVTLTQSQYNSILNRLSALENNSSNTITNANYSTEEKAVGTWIDGKTLYEKTITVSGCFYGSVSNLSTNITNADFIMIKEGSFIISNGQNYPIPYVHSTSENNIGLFFQPGYSTFGLRCGSAWDSSSYISKIIMTLHYTKTTDNDKNN